MTEFRGFDLVSQLRYAREEGMAGLAKIRQWLTQQIRPYEGKTDSRWAFELISAVDEACSNSIKYVQGEEITLLLLEGKDGLLVQLVEKGHSFDLESYWKKFFTVDDSDKGYGIYLIKNLVDQASYQQGSENNTFYLYKKFGHS